MELGHSATKVCTPLTATLIVLVSYVHPCILFGGHDTSQLRMLTYPVEESDPAELDVNQPSSQTNQARLALNGVTPPASRSPNHNNFLSGVLF